MFIAKTVKRRIRILWARYSIPTLLAQGDEKRVVSIIAAINGGISILIIGIIAGLIKMPLLFPALGPSVFLMSTSPFTPSCQPRSILIAHHIGLFVGVVVWQFLNLFYSGEGTELYPSLTAIYGAALSLAGISVILVMLHRPHPPACATAMIVGMGGAQEWSMLFGMSCAVFLLVITSRSVIRLAGLNAKRATQWQPLS